MNIITLFCEIDDFFLAYEKWQGKALPTKGDLAAGNTRASTETASQRSDDAPDRLP